MKTDYLGHDRAYLRKRQDSNFEGWGSDMEIVPPQNSEDIAELRAIALKL